MTQEGVYEPLNTYNNTYKDLHNQNTIELFDSLIEKSNIDPQLNRELNSKIDKLDSSHKDTSKKIKKQKTIKVLLIILSIVSVGIFFTGNIILIALGLVIISLSIVFLVKQKPKLEELKKSEEKLSGEIKALTDQAWAQLEPLNQLFTEEMPKELFRKTLPLINLDDLFDSQRLEYLVRKFDLDEDNDNDRSALFVQSGDIKGNPFFICKDLVHEMGTKKYTGSITIHWTTTARVNGKLVRQRRSQRLTASVHKPAPFYREQPYLVYGNEAAPDLIFSREDSDAEHLTQKQIDRLVNKNIKKLKKKAEKSISKGDNYTVLGNSEFEVLFGATNRNDEVQFRLLFTPLAQKQLLQLMKDKEIGFGDDFDYVKHKKINMVFPEHLKNLKLNIDASYFHGYNIDQVRNKFIEYNNSYFKHIYFTFAPILSIPLYHQYKTQEYIYEGLYDSYASFYEHEVIVNKMNLDEFKHPSSQTSNILKTSVVKSEKNCDTISVTAYGYETIERIDYVNKLGGDGKMHSIPVRWIEYIPVSNTTDVTVDLDSYTASRI